MVSADPFFSAPISDMMNLSLSSSTVPRQWKAASILPIPKIPSPLSPSDYRPISITPVLSRLLERVVVTDYTYPFFQSPPPNISFMDQFVFQPTASTTVALIYSSPPHHHHPPSNQRLSYRVRARFFQGLRQRPTQCCTLQISAVGNARQHL